MRIVHVMAWYIPGMGYQENLLPTEQAKLGHQVEVITSDRLPAFKGYGSHVGKLMGGRYVGSGEFRDGELVIHRLDTALEVKSGGWLLMSGVKSQLKDSCPDVVHSHGAFAPHTLETVLFSENLQYKLFVDDHSHSTNFRTDTLAKKGYVEMTRAFYRFYGNRVRCWMPVTYASKAILESLLSISEDRSELLPLGADARRFRKSDELRRRGRSRLGISGDEFLVLTSGKFDSSKDIHVLLAALGGLMHENPSLKLAMVGNGPDDYITHLKSLAKALGIAKRIIFVDFVPNSRLPELYNAADLGVWPGDPSITVIEALGTGLPIIVPSDDLGYKVVFDANAAVGFKRGDADALQSAIRSAIHDARLRSEVSMRAEMLVKDELSWERIALKSINVYSR
jgi:glycosyltransferase involved in cell wall biosynthesis